MTYLKKMTAMLLLLSVLFLQGCSLTEPETSHLVQVSEDGTTLEADLKASVNDGYEWQYLFDSNNFVELSVKHTNNIFSNTYGTKYSFEANDVCSDTFYLILVKDGDYDTAKVFSYVLSSDDNKRITIEKEGNYLLASDIVLYKKVVGE